MFRKLLAVLGFAIPVFTAQAAHADWLMVGAYDFQPYDRSTAYEFAGGRGGYVSSGFNSVKAPVRIPIGKSFRSLYCQVFDVSASRDISVSLTELQSSDYSSNFGASTIMSMASSGQSGHNKISAYPSGTAVVAKTYACPTSECIYYSYYLTVTLPDASNTAIKSCAIEYY